MYIWLYLYGTIFIVIIIIIIIIILWCELDCKFLKGYLKPKLSKLPKKKQQYAGNPVHLFNVDLAEDIPS